MKIDSPSIPGFRLHVRIKQASDAWLTVHYQLLLAGYWFCTQFHTLECTRHRIPLDERVMRQAALVFSCFDITHLTPLDQPLKQWSTSVVVKRLGYKDAEAVKLAATPSVAKHASTPRALLEYRTLHISTECWYLIYTMYFPFHRWAYNLWVFEVYQEPFLLCVAICSRNFPQYFGWLPSATERMHVIKIPDRDKWILEMLALSHLKTELRMIGSLQSLLYSLHCLHSLYSCDEPVRRRRLLSNSLADREFWWFGALWSGDQFRGSDPTACHGCSDCNLNYLRWCQYAVQMCRFCCSELSSAGPVIVGTSSPGHCSV